MCNTQHFYYDVSTSAFLSSQGSYLSIYLTIYILIHPAPYWEFGLQRSMLVSVQTPSLTCAAEKCIEDVT